MRAFLTLPDQAGHLAGGEDVDEVTRFTRDIVRETLANDDVPRATELLVEGLLDELQVGGWQGKR